MPSGNLQAIQAPQAARRRRQNGNILVIRTLLFAFVFPLLLVACKSELQPPEAAPANFRVTPGDSQAVLTWDMQPGQIYSVYYQAGPTVSTGSYIGFATHIVSPFTVTGLANQTQYAFIINASNDGSVAGPSTSVVTVTPGGTGRGQAWTVGTGLTGASLRSVAFGNQTYVAVGDGASLFTANQSNTSSSGIGAWNPPVGNNLPVPVNSNLASVVFNGNSFVAMAADGQIIISPSASNWTVATAVGSGVQWTSIAYGNGIYVAVGLGGSIKTNNRASVNTAWTTQTSHTTKDLFGVTYVHGIFIAAGNAGALLTSPDGTNWTVQNSGTTQNLYKAAYGAGEYVVVGNAGTVLSSPDAINWAPETAPAAGNLYGVAYGVSAEFVIVGDGGVILSSPAGTDGTWTAATTTASGALNDIVAGGTVFVAVGDFGANVSGN
jgi:hypothetical protein